MAQGRRALGDHRGNNGTHVFSGRRAGHPRGFLQLIDHDDRRAIAKLIRAATENLSKRCIRRFRFGVDANERDACGFRELGP